MNPDDNITPEERKRLIDSIPEASAVDRCKENIIPRREGRSVRGLTTTLQMNSAEKEQIILKGKREFKEKLETIDDIDDPLQVYIDQVKWTVETFPTGSLEYHLMSLLHDATNKFKNSKTYKQDPRYLKLWMEYSQWVEEPNEIFEFLIRNGIGKNLALFYEEYAAYLERLQKYDEALEAYDLGIEIEATPLKRLKRNREQLKLRIEELKRIGLMKKKEQESIRQMNELKANNRTMLGQKFDSRSRSSVSANVYAGIQSAYGSPSSSSSSSRQSMANDEFSIPASNNTSSRIQVFRDDTPQINTYSPRNILNKSSIVPSHFRPSSPTTSASENRILPEKFSGATIPQLETVRPPVEKFIVYKDPEESTPKPLKRYNSSMLSEASSEESSLSKMRKYPTSEIEGTTCKKSKSDHNIEIEEAHAKRMENHFKRNRRFYLENKDTKGVKEVLTVLKTTHVSTSFEEERAIELGIPYKVRKEDRDGEEEPESGFTSYYNLNKTTPLEEGFTTETRKAVESLKELMYGDNVYDEDEEDLTWTNPIQHFNPPPLLRRKPNEK